MEALILQASNLIDQMIHQVEDRSGPGVLFEEHQADQGACPHGLAGLEVPRGEVGKGWRRQARGQLQGNHQQAVPGGVVPRQ